MKTNLLNRVIAVVSIAGLAIAVQAQTIKVDVSKVENNISPYLYGSCMEDVNHEIYGGLYNQRIFGESFEEPASSGGILNFLAIDESLKSQLPIGGFATSSLWSLNDGIVHVNAYDGAKLVYQPIDLQDGTIEVELKFDQYGNNDDNAGLLVRLTDPNPGADSFNGYEISLTSEGKRVLIGRHQYDYSFLTENRSVSVNPTDWVKMKVELDGNNIKVYINDVRYLDHNNNAILGAGKVTLRNWRAGVSYRNLKITPKNESLINVAFNEDNETSVSRMWDMIASETATVKFNLTDDAYNTNQAQEIDFQSGVGVAGVANRSLNKWGIAVKEDQTFEGSLFLKGNITGKIKVALQSVDGAMEYAVQEIDAITNDWSKYTFSLTSNATDNNARFAIYIDNTGKFLVDMVTLMGTGDDLFRGLPFRNDIGQAMVDQGLTFLRYGGTMVNNDDYLFKNMIGPREDRPIYDGHWYDYSTNGFGIEEFVQFSEAAGFEYCFSVNVLESAQDMADMIEYMKGDATTTWGKKRAENGHPEPYKLNYIAIGNEEVIWGDNRNDYQTYINQFNTIYDAIRAKDPDIKFVHAAWWRPDSPANMKMVFDALNGKAEYWDYHPWTEDPNVGRHVQSELEDMKAKFLQWDPNTNMKCALFEENGNIHNMQRALAHATVQNAARRMGDFMLSTCAANALEPYRQNDNGWNQGQIFFTPSQVWGMPPYYAQQMASKNHLPLRVSASVVGNLDVTATRSEDGTTLALHIVNTGGRAANSTIQLDDFGEGQAIMDVWTLSGSLNAANTPEEPERIVPIEETQTVNAKEFTYQFLPYSYTIIKLSGGSGLSINPVKNAAEIKAIRQGDAFVLTYPKDTTSVSVYNASSQLIAEYSLSSGGTDTMPMADLASGVYLLEFNGRKTTILKVLK